MTTGIRYRPEGWEFRCGSCARQGKQSYWPLTPEFWSPRLGMARCRACLAESRNVAERRRYRENHAEILQRNAAYRRACAPELAAKARQRWAEADAEKRERSYGRAAAWRKANPDAWRAIKARWRANHLEEARMIEREAARRRRAS